MTAQLALEQLVMLPQAECPTQLIPVGLQSCIALGEIKRAQPGKKCQNIINSDIRQVQIKRWKSVVIFISRRQQSQCCFLSIAQRSTKKLVLLLWVIGSSSFPASGYGQDSLVFEGHIYNMNSEILCQCLTRQTSSGHQGIPQQSARFLVMLISNAAHGYLSFSSSLQLGGKRHKQVVTQMSQAGSSVRIIL